MGGSLDEDLCRLALEEAARLGCAYAEARLHTNTYYGWFVRNGAVEPAGIGETRGIGVRVIWGGGMGFGATNTLTREAVAKAVEAAVKAAKASSGRCETVSLSKEEAAQERWGVGEQKKLSEVSGEQVVSFLRELDGSVAGGLKGMALPFRMFSVSWAVEEKLYANSEGSKIESRVPRVWFYSVFVGLKDGEPVSISIPPGYSGLGGSGGFEIIERLKLHEYLPQRLGEVAEAVLKAAPPPRGEKLDVVLGPNVASLTSHESVGHPFEADRILGREGAQAGESYLKPDRYNVRIGGDEAYVSDDPTIPGSMGFYLYDDEGVKARRRKLLQAGYVSELLLNRAAAAKFGKKSNAAARAVRYSVEPLIRMANTYIEPGDWSFEELVKETKRGVYIKSFMEWNIDDKRLNQRYVGLEAFLIERGEIRGPLNKPILEISTPKYWSSIDARAKDLEFYVGTCGKGDPMQGAPVYFGSPHIRLRGVVLG